jgi:hypothetical protein
MSTQLTLDELVAIDIHNARRVLGRAQPTNDTNQEQTS